MDPTFSTPIHPSSLHATTSPEGHPILSTSPGAPSASGTAISGAGSGTGTGTAPLPAPKSAAPSADPIAGLSAPSGVGADAKPQSKSSSSSATPAPDATGLRQRASAQLEQGSAKLSHQLDAVNESPAVKDAKAAAGRQLQGAREYLGRYPVLVDLEKRSGVDRVGIAAGGVLLYLILIPLNLLHLALPTTQLLTFLPPSALAVRTLDKPNEERTKTLLSYFVVFGFVQFIESLMADFLERRIPQYYTVKLLFLAYLIHPKTKGARKIHQSILRPLLAKSQGRSSTSASGSAAGNTNTKSTAYSHTPPSTSSASGSAHASPRASEGFALSSDGSARVPPVGSAGAPVPTVGSTSGVGAPLASAGGFSGNPASAHAGYSGTI